MKKWIIVILLVFLVAGMAYGKYYEVKKAAGAYSVTVAMDKNPPAQGVNGIENNSFSVKTGSWKK